MVDVPAVGAEDGILAQETGARWKDRRRGWEWTTAISGAAMPSSGGRRFLGPQDAIAAEQESDQQASRVAQKDGSGVLKL